MTEERIVRPNTGWMPLAICIALIIAGFSFVIMGAAEEKAFPIFGGVASAVCGIVGLFGCMPVAPNESRVLLLFGVYKGSVVESGFYWVNPFFSKKKVSLRVHNFETGAVTTPEKKDEHGRVTQKKSRSAGHPSRWMTMRILWPFKAKRRCGILPAGIRMTARTMRYPSAAAQRRSATNCGTTYKSGSTKRA